jgi:hypothetical protein
MIEDEDTHYRTLKNVQATFDHRKEVPDENGKLSIKKPGWIYHKNYSDGSKEYIPEETYLALKHYNTLPQDAKEKHPEYLNKVNINYLTGKAKEIALLHKEIRKNLPKKD